MGVAGSGAAGGGRPLSGGRVASRGGLRKGGGGDALSGAALAAVDDRLSAHGRNLIPGRAALPAAEMVDLFEKMATEVAATVRRVATPDDVPDAVADFLAGLNLPSAVKAAPDPRLDDIPWSKRPTLTVTRGAAADADLTAVTAATAAIAETGTLMLASSAAAPTTLNFLPDNHIVVLRAGQVTGTYEDGWDLVRAAGALPRTVNFVTGPSRTGDIEQKIQLGAHGPRRLHIILVEDGA